MTDLRDRRVSAEVLDSLPPGHPEAIRSRRDLQVIDAVMGNTRWVLSRLKGLGFEPGSVGEIGAGEGGLLRRIARCLPSAELVGYDLQPGPGDFSGWVVGDAARELGVHDVVVGCLIAHHWDRCGLEALGRRLAGCRVAMFVEPHRTRCALVLAALAAPFVGRVTRHDMPASILAGFRHGELQAFLGLEGWRVRESCTPFGALRFFAEREAGFADPLPSGGRAG